MSVQSQAFTLKNREHACAASGVAAAGQFALDRRPGAAPAADGGAAADLFLARIGPLFKQRCLACHGDDPKKLKGGLDLRSREAMLQGGESGEPAVVPGVPDESPLYRAVTREDPTLAMPPKENDKLAAEDVTAIRAWIEGGAPWPLAERQADRRSPRPGTPEEG